MFADPFNCNSCYIFLSQQQTLTDLQSLAAVFLLGGSVLQLDATYSNPDVRLPPWVMSPSRIRDSDRSAHFGDVRYQRAYMDYFSVEHTNKDGVATLRWALDQLWKAEEDGKVLIYGLFGKSGRSLLFLADGLEVPTAVMVVQGLTLAAIDWSQPIQDLIAATCASPEQSQVKGESAFSIFYRIGNDGRFSGLPGPGVQNFSAVMNDARMHQALSEYVRRLDVSDTEQTLRELCRLSVLVACATHHPGRPAFDLWLARLPSLVVSLAVLQVNIAASGASRDMAVVLVRGVWMLMLVAYVSHMRPVVDEGLVSGPTTTRTWEHILAEFRADAFLSGSKYLDSNFTALLRSIHRLAEVDNDPNWTDWYRKMGSYLVGNWTKWGSAGNPRELHLNIRM